MEDFERYDEFLQETHRRADWGEAPRGESPHVRVEHLIHLIMRTIIDPVARQPVDDLMHATITPVIMKEWISQSTLGERIMKDRPAGGPDERGRARL